MDRTKTVPKQDFEGMVCGNLGRGWTSAFTTRLMFAVTPTRSAMRVAGSRGVVKQFCRRCRRPTVTFFRRMCLYFVRTLQASFGSFTTLPMNSFGGRIDSAIKRAS